jgi:hypothetical protein
MGTAEALLDGGTILAVVILASHAMVGWPDTRVLRHLHHSPTPRPGTPPHRPFEDLVTRARVLGPRLRSVQPGMRFAKFDGMRQGYDAVLGELADELGIPHLLAVIPAGPALDTERARVEKRLELAGVDLGLPLV